MPFLQLTRFGIEIICACMVNEMHSGNSSWNSLTKFNISCPSLVCFFLAAGRDIISHLLNRVRTQKVKGQLARKGLPSSWQRYQIPADHLASFFFRFALLELQHTDYRGSYVYVCMGSRWSNREIRSDRCKRAWERMK